MQIVTQAGEKSNNFHAVPDGYTLNLRPYQQETLRPIDNALARGINRQLVSLPTGTGKTVVFSHLLKAKCRLPAIVLAHRDELIGQAADKIYTVDPTAQIGIVKAERDELDMPIILASVQTLARPSRLKRLPPTHFKTIIVDEAHHSSSESYRRILEHLGAFQENGPLTVGLTATPFRADGQALGDIFRETVYSKGILEMIQAEYLCDLRAIQIRLAADFNGLHTRHGDFIESESANLLMDADAPTHAVEAYREHASVRKALIFTPTVDLAHLMISTFSNAGIKAEALDSTTPLQERRNILKRLTHGKIQVLANCGVLIEGFDEPSIDCIIVARPTRSRVLYTQMVGRGTRLCPGKEDCLILDLVGATDRHGLMTAASIFNIKSEMLSRLTLSEAVHERERRERIQQQKLDGRIVYRIVDLFKRRKLHWVKSEERFALSVGLGFIVLEPREDKWSVSLKQKDRSSVLASGLSLEYAQGYSEDYARKLGAGSLVNPSAKWRQREASEKQLAALRRFRIQFPVGITAGQASDLITSRIAGCVA